MNLIEDVLKTVESHGMLAHGDAVLVGLSGGPDSVCLLEVLTRLRERYGLSLHAVYIDHGLRPSDTPGEIEFAKTLAEGRGVDFYAEKVGVAQYAKSERMGTQEAARALRYQALETLADRLGAGKIALGHNADDQVETFFMRLLRGSGAKGLSGIPPVRKTISRGKSKSIIRPLIETPRAAIEEFLREVGAAFVTDPSNLKRHYTRNRIRHDLVPVLKGFNPRLSEAVLRTTRILAEEDGYFETIVLKGLMPLFRRKTDEEVELFIVPLESMNTVLLRRTLRKLIELVKNLRGLDFKHIEEIMGLIKKGRPGDRLYLPGGIQAIKKYSTFLITSKKVALLEPSSLDCAGSLEIAGAGAVITASIEENDPGRADGRLTAVLDASKTGLRLTVRGRKEGDFFYPSGFGHRKKLQDFLVDEKVPRHERDSIPIVASGEDIVWVAGMRADDRFIAREGTKQFLVLRLHTK